MFYHNDWAICIFIRSTYVLTIHSMLHISETKLFKKFELRDRLRDNIVGIVYCWSHWAMYKQLSTTALFATQSVAWYWPLSVSGYWSGEGSIPRPGSEVAAAVPGCDWSAAQNTRLWLADDPSWPGDQDTALWLRTFSPCHEPHWESINIQWSHVTSSGLPDVSNIGRQI